jgi:hypothetical protein
MLGSDAAPASLPQHRRASASATGSTSGAIAASSAPAKSVHGEVGAHNQQNPLLKFAVGGGVTWAFELLAGHGEFSRTSGSGRAPKDLPGPRALAAIHAGLVSADRSAKRP